MVLGTIAAAAILAFGLIHVCLPVLRHHALARPNARSSHVAPTPQGGGIAVIAATVAVSGLMFLVDGSPDATFVAVLIATLALALVGGLDDIRPLGVVSRVAVQAVCVILVVYEATAHERLLDGYLPLQIERLILVLAVLWFVNLTNFMDGIDWMTVAAMVPIAAALVLFGAAGVVEPRVTFAAAALLGALIGFAPFNRPTARLFLGDVGALPIGLVVAWMLFELARSDGAAAAIILPLYYLSDATITLLRRLFQGERLWEAHRTHFYQRATENGLSVLQVSVHVFVLNCVLAGLAAMTLTWSTPSAQAIMLATSAGLVVATLVRFSRRRPC